MSTNILTRDRIARVAPHHSAGPTSGAAASMAVHASIRIQQTRQRPSATAWSRRRTRECRPFINRSYGYCALRLKNMPHARTKTAATVWQSHPPRASSRQRLKMSLRPRGWRCDRLAGSRKEIRRARKRNTFSEAPAPHERDEAPLTLLRYKGGEGFPLDVGLSLLSPPSLSSRVSLFSLNVIWAF